MSDRYRKQWESLGSADPYWAVLTDGTRKDGQWDSSSFFESGRAEIDEVLSQLGRLGADPLRGLAVDFGCGVGRLSRALSRHFKQVVAIDIAESMLGEARRANTGFPNITFCRSSAPPLQVLADRSVDFFYSNITLQHMPARQQLNYLEDFCRVIRPGGALVFQTPADFERKTLTGLISSLLGNPLMNILRRFRYGSERIMEMHVLARSRVEERLRSKGLSILDVQRYDSAGHGFVSFRYFAALKEQAGHES